MKTLGIIAEFHPFHSGHAYFISQAKEIISPDYTVCVMSGNFVQRGIPAIIDKHNRAKEAIAGGIDAVFEMPVSIATGSAAYFAQGAIMMLKGLHCTHIAFGAECDDLSLLKSIANCIVNEPESVKEEILAETKNGTLYQKARALAISNYLDNNQVMEVMELPNNILAIEYLVAGTMLSYPFTPVIIKRVGSGYHDIAITKFPSATSIRNHVASKKNIDDIKKYLSDMTYQDLISTNFVSSNDFTKALQYKIYERKTSFEKKEIFEMSDEMWNRLLSLPYPTMTYDEIAEGLMSRQITRTRANRALLHLLLDISSEKAFMQIKEATKYYRLLAAKKDTTHILKEMIKAYDLTIITKVKKGLSELTDEALYSFMLDLNASMLYYEIKSGITGKAESIDISLPPVML